MSVQVVVDEWVDEEPEDFDRISFRPDLLGGKPCIAGSRISVKFVLECLASGGSIADIVRTWPHLRTEDVQQAILFAAANLKNDIFLVAECPIGTAASASDGWLTIVC